MSVWTDLENVSIANIGGYNFEVARIHNRWEANIHIDGCWQPVCGDCLSRESQKEACESYGNKTPQWIDGQNGLTAMLSTGTWDVTITRSVDGAVFVGRARNADDSQKTFTSKSISLRDAKNKIERLIQLEG